MLFYATVFTIIFVVLNVCSRYYEIPTKSHLHPLKGISDKEKNVVALASTPTKDLIYLIQTESCLSTYVLHPGLLGRGDSRKVVVLSWKNPCNEAKARHFSHIQYLHKPDTTWGEGRNILYRFAKSLSKKYLYYIFLDDDIKFYFINSFYKQYFLTRSIYSPLHAFEQFLRKHEPAVGMPMHCSICLRPTQTKGEMERLCCDKMKQVDPLPSYLPVTIHFDAAFNAFHKDAVDLLLPYRLHYESQSWWESQKFVILASDILFRGQVLRFSPATVIDTKHRNYPKSELDNWSVIYNMLKSEIARGYRNKLIFIPNSSNVDAFPVVRNNTVYTSNLNITIPLTKTAVIPFRHLN